jgi:hypothetical protein
MILRSLDSSNLLKWFIHSNTKYNVNILIRLQTSIATPYLHQMLHAIQNLHYSYLILPTGK